MCNVLEYLYNFVLASSLLCYKLLGKLLVIFLLVKEELKHMQFTSQSFFLL